MKSSISRSAAWLFTTRRRTPTRSSAPSTTRPLFVGTTIAREPRQYVHSVRVRFLPQLRDKRVRDALREQRLERGELGAFPLATHCGSLPQLIADGHVHPPRRAIRRDDSANHRRLGQHRVLRPSNELCREQRGNVLTCNDRSAAARTHDRRQASWRLRLSASSSSASWLFLRWLRHGGCLD